MFKLIYTKQADFDLSRLPSNIRQRILTKMDFFIQQKNPLYFAKRLKNSILGQYRFRIGDYRVIFDVDRQGAISILLILKIKHRKDVYNFN